MIHPQTLSCKMYQMKTEEQKKTNFRLAMILLGVVLAFFFGIIVRFVVLGG